MPIDDSFLMGPANFDETDTLPDCDPETDLLDWEVGVEIGDLIGPTFPGGIWTREEYEARLAYEKDAPKWEQFLEDIEKIKKCRKKLFAQGKSTWVEMLDYVIHAQAEFFSELTLGGDK